MSEMIDEIDLNGNIIATHPSSLLKTEMFLHNVCLILPKDSEQRFILSRRLKKNILFQILGAVQWEESLDLEKH
jgi:hypothetical protein